MTYTCKLFHFNIYSKEAFIYVYLFVLKTVLNIHITGRVRKNFSKGAGLLIAMATQAAAFLGISLAQTFAG